MYIRFRLPQHGDYHRTLELIKQQVQSWAEQYSVRYTQKTIKYEHRVAFDHDETYTMWAMTWNPPEPWRRWLDYELVNVAGERY